MLLLSLTTTLFSDMRQVPDNQEVFLASDSDTSYILEILAEVEEGAAKTDLWDAAKWVLRRLVVLLL